MSTPPQGLRGHSTRKIEGIKGKVEHWWSRKSKSEILTVRSHEDGDGHRSCASPSSATVTYSPHNTLGIGSTDVNPRIYGSSAPVSANTSVEAISIAGKAWSTNEHSRSYPVSAPSTSPSTAPASNVESSSHAQTSSVYPSILVTSNEGSPHGNRLDVVKAGFKTLLRLVESSSSIFPPLKSAVAGLLGVIELVELTSKNQDEFRELESKLAAVLSIIESHASESSHELSRSSLFARRLEGLSIAIKHQLSVVMKKKEHGFAHRLAEVNSDASQIAKVYRTLIFLFQAFTMDVTLSTEQITQNILSHTSLMILDKLSQVPSAAYNASSPTQRHGCTDKTRESILAQLVAWATYPKDNKIYWLNGMAGTGKTTIAYTFSEILDKNQMLGASFFCSRLEESTGNINRIFPTIAYQLALRYPAVFQSLVPIIERDPEVTSRTIVNQFQDIIVEPLRAAFNDLADRPAIISIEGLDECFNQEEVGRLLSVISQYSSTLPVKFFITSRPEQRIRQGFNRRDFVLHSKFLLHDVEMDVVKADIERYTRRRLMEIADGRSALGGTLDDWPPEHEVQALVNLAGNLFIYAATACEYVNGGGNIRERLSLVTNISPGSTDGETGALDALYNNIISAAFDGATTREQEDVKLVLRAVLNVHKPLSVRALSTLLGISIERVKSALSPLHSVIHVPSFGNLGDPISALHASFPDYIASRGRSKDNHLDGPGSHKIIALHCLALMNSSLTENICQMRGQMSNDEIPLSTITEHISESFSYACTYWALHIAKTSADDSGIADLYRDLLQFFDYKVLNWVECESVIGELGTVIGFLRELEIRLQPIPDLLNAATDARRFITENFEIFSNHSLETYRSALVWLPEESRIREKYLSKRVLPWKLISGARTKWNACETISIGHSDTVSSVRFSPDSVHVISGSSDKTVRLWNARTGEFASEFMGHVDRICSVAFSADGTQVLSGSRDESVRIWNAETGEKRAEIQGLSNNISSMAFSGDGSRIAFDLPDFSLQIRNLFAEKFELLLEGHTDRVYSIAFSQEGGHIVSGSDDKTVRVWNVISGECERKLVGHSNRVRAVAFSPNGDRVVSGSDDKTIRIWNIKTGRLEIELGGHSHKVRSVAFSSDGTRVVSGSYTVRVWNANTGDSEARLVGHSGLVHSVAFSPDGSQIVSGSDDKTVRVWNAEKIEPEAIRSGSTRIVYSVAFSPDGRNVVSGSDGKAVQLWSAMTGKLEATLMGHSAAVNSVAYSSDGTHVVSGSADKSIRIWNMATRKSVAKLVGHAGMVFSVAFSFDGCRVVSGSYTVRIWNAKTGEPEARLVGHSNRVRSVAFSPDESRVVSGSDDRSVRIWNVGTGECEVKLVGRSWTMDSVVLPQVGRILTLDDEVQIPSPELAKTAILPDGTEVHWDSRGFVIIPNPSHSTPKPSLYLDKRFIRHRERGQWCWVPPQFRNPDTVSYHMSKIVLGYAFGTIIILEFVG